MSEPSPVGNGAEAKAASRGGRIAWWVTAGLAGLAVLLIAVAALSPEKPLVKIQSPLPNVETATIQTRTYEDALLLPARLEADHEAVVSSELGGTLGRWLVAEGAAVERGQVVAELDLSRLEVRRQEILAALTVSQETKKLAEVNQVRSTQALETGKLQLQAAASSLALAESEYQRTKALYEGGASSRSAMDAADNAYTQAKLGVSQAKNDILQAEQGVRAASVQASQADASLKISLANLQALEVDFAKAKVCAAVSGKLDKHLVQPGEVVSPGQKLGHIYDLDYLRACVDIADRYSPFLDANNSAVDAFITANQPGAKRRLKASVILPGLPKLTGGNGDGLTFPAEIVYIAQGADPQSNTFRVELRLANPGGALRHGMVGQANIMFLEHLQAIVIPLSSIQVSDSGPRVLVVESGEAQSEVARVRDIVPVSITGDRVHVTSGLKGGDRLIVAGGKGIVDGQAVSVIRADGEFRLQK